jgi:hypothetical protein
LFVNVADILGNPVNSTFVTINTEWDNRVQLDQTVNDTSEANLQAFTFSDSNWNTSGPATATGITTAFHQRASSLAPTKEGNCYDPDNDGCDTYYTKFADAEEDIQEQILEYEGAEVIISGFAAGTVTIDLLPDIISNITNLEFLAPIDIDKLKFLLPGTTDEIGVIQATRNIIDTYKLTAQQTGSALGHNIKIELNTLEEDVEYNFIDSIEDSPVGGSNIVNYTVVDINNLVDESLYAIPFTPIPDPEGLDALIAGAELRSTVTIPGAGVKYFNNGLPLTDDSEIINQAVEILSGSVFSPGAIKASSADIELYGDVAVYEMRSIILKNVSNLIKGITIRRARPITINNSISQRKLFPHQLKDGRVYFFENTDVHLESVANLSNYTPSTDSPISIILRGGDLYIDGNINESGDPTPIGLIVMESNTDTNELTKGGHLYVHADVTDMVEVSIFADGPMFRYTSSVCFNSSDGLRETNFVDG